jgi:hypothetical protein
LLVVVFDNADANQEIEEPAVGEDFPGVGEIDERAQEKEANQIGEYERPDEITRA